MDTNRDDRTLALAGIFQGAGLAQELALQGRIAHSQARDASLASIFASPSESVADVFGGIAGVRLGLGLLRDQIQGPGGSGRHRRDLDLSRYVIGLTVLERKLAASPNAWAELGAGLEEARWLFQSLGPSHSTLTKRLAELYVEHISPLGARIIVRGGEEPLTDPDRIAHVRALLLAGLRAAVLWRQQGGRRWHLLAGRRRYLGDAERLLAKVPAS